MRDSVHQPRRAALSDGVAEVGGIISLPSGTRTKSVDLNGAKIDRP